MQDRSGEIGRDTDGAGNNDLAEHLAGAGRLDRQHAEVVNRNPGTGPEQPIRAAITDQHGRLARLYDDAGTTALGRDRITLVGVDQREHAPELWDELFPAEQARIVALLVERVDIGTDGLNVRLRSDDLASLVHEFDTNRRAAA